MPNTIFYNNYNKRVKMHDDNQEETGLTQSKYNEKTEVETTMLEDNNHNMLPIIDGPSPSSSSQKLNRSLTLFNGISLVIGTIIGSGIFASPGVVYRHTGSGGAALLLWVFSGLLAYAGALCFAELSCSIESAGGEVEYLRRSYGNFVSFLFTWTNAVITRPASFGIICIVFGEYSCKSFFENSSCDSENSMEVKLFALLCACMVFFMNASSVRITSLVLGYVTIFKVFILLFIAVCGFIALVVPPPSSTTNHDSNNNNGTTTLSPISFENSSSNLLSYPAAFLAALFAYDGWNNCIYASEEMINPLDQIRAIRFSIPCVIFLYTLVNASYLIVLPANVVTSSSTLGVELAASLFGSAGRIVMPIIVASSAFGAALGGVFSSSRLVYAGGRDGLLPKFFGKLSDKTKTPVRSLVSQFVIASVLIVMGNFEILISIFGFAVWLFYCLTAVGIYRLRTLEPDLGRPYMVNNVTGFFFCFMSGCLVITVFVSSPVESLLSIGFILLGVPYYWFFVMKNDNVTPATTAIANVEMSEVPLNSVIEYS